VSSPNKEPVTVVRKPRAGRESSRLAAQDWIEAAMKVLVTHGVESVRVERLAKDLGVTKGSFYWHFKDREALLDALLNHWRRNTTLDIISKMEEQDGTPRDRITRLMLYTLKAQIAAPAAVELSIRVWSFSDARVREIVREIDMLRHRYVERLLEQMGFSREEAHIRGVYLAGFTAVAATVIDPDLIDRALNLMLPDVEPASGAPQS
jgi:AcrR family transcriptional regulator